MKTVKNIFSSLLNGTWGEGVININIPYNLRKVLVVLLFIISIPFLILYFIIKGIVMFCKWIGPWIKGFFVVLMVLIYTAWEWFRNLFVREKKPATPETVKEPKERRKWWMWFLLIIPILILLFLWRSCGKDEEAQFPDEVYDIAFDDVVVSRAYLDGVQDGSKLLALVGIKYIDGKPANQYDFEGKTYDESVKVIANTFKPFVINHLAPSVLLTKEQMTVVTLAAMRMGEYGFPRSTFLQKINEGKLKEAGEWLLLQKADGKKRETGPEPKQYFYILRLLWEGEITAKDLLDMPMFSYKGVSHELMYDENENFVLIEDIKERLKVGEFRTPRQALELE